MKKQFSFIPGIHAPGTDVTIPAWVGRVLKIVQASALKAASGSTGGGGAHSHAFGTLAGQVTAGVTAVKSDAESPVVPLNAGASAGHTLLAADIPAHTHANQAAVALTVVTGAPGGGEIRLKDPNTIQHGDATDAYQVTVLIVEVEGEGLVP